MSLSSLVTCCLCIFLILGKHGYTQQTYQRTTPIYYDANPAKGVSYKRPEVRTFKFPQHIVADSKGNIFVSRTLGTISGDKLIKITPDGSAIEFAGYIIKDHRNFTVQNKNTGSIKGMAIDELDNIYVSSMDNAGAINKISPDGSLQRIAGAPYREQGSKAGDFAVKDGVGENARFWDPGNMATDKLGNIYVVDGGPRTWDKADGKHGYIIRKVSAAGEVTTLRSDTGILRYKYLRGLACDADNNLLLCLTTLSCIQQLGLNGLLTTIAGSCNSQSVNMVGGANKTLKASITSPSHLFVAKNGDIFFSDSRMNRIMKIAGNKIMLVSGDNKVHGSNAAGGSYEGYLDGKALQALYNEPMGLTMDAAGNIYIADAGNHCIRKLSPTGVVSTFSN